MTEEFVERGGKGDDFPNGKAEIVYCKYCKVAMLLPPGSEPDCGRHGN